MSNIVFYLIALLILAILIVVHEFGHYLIGRILGFKVLEFAVGFGPKLIKWERKGIKYSIRAIPLGGFCSFAGEDEDSVDDPRAMNNMPWYKRLAVLFSGAGFNIVFALIIGFVLFVTSGYSVATIKSIEEGTPIASTTAMAGDIIVAVNGQRVTTSSSLTNMINDAAESDDKVTLTLNRNGEQFDITTVFYVDYVNYTRIQYEVLSDNTVRVYSVGDDSPFAGLNLQKGDIVVAVNGKKIKGIAELNNEIKHSESSTATLTLLRNGSEFEVTANLVMQPYNRVGITLSYANAPMPIGEAVTTTFTSSWKLGGDILSLLGQIVTGQADMSMVTGPVTTIGTMGSIVGQSAEGGLWSVAVTVLNLLWAISINLAVFNLLPIPALDGARMVFVLIEGIFRKAINREVEGKIHAIGFMLLILLVIVLEVSKIFTGVGGSLIWI